VIGIDVVVDLLGGLPDEKQPAADQDEVAPGKAVSEDGEDRIRQMDDEGHGAEKAEAQDEREPDTHAACLRLLLLRELVRQD
jgi:hypothetical protein